MTKRSIFLILLLLFVSCKQLKKEETQKENLKSDVKQDNYDIFVSSDRFSVYNEKFEMVKQEIFSETIISSSVFEKKLYLAGKNLYAVNLTNMQTLLVGKINAKPTTNNLISNRQGVIYISGSSLIFKDKNKEQPLLTCDSPITKVWDNPYHMYIYCHDSSGYLYAIDLLTKTLKRRFFIGNVKTFSFSKYGTRILAVTDKSFLVLDYETLNIIFEKKDFFSDALSFETKDLMFLYSGIDRKCWIYSNIDYKKKKDFITNENDLKLFTADDSLMLLFSKDKKTLTLFKRDNKANKKAVKMDGALDMLRFEGERVYLKSDSLIFVYELKTDSVKKAGYFPDFLAFHSFSLEKPIEPAEQGREKESIGSVVFSIQIYALSNKDYADKMADQLKAKIGSDVFVSDTLLSGKSIYRVFAGKFESKESADLFREDLVKKGFGRDILVKRVKVND